MANKSEITLGKIIEGDASRDAIHIAIAPVVASCRLAPGQDIGFSEEGNNELVDCMNVPGFKPIGIVDPFLKGMVCEEQRFWMFLYPNTITSLRHDWTHPAFESCGTNKESIAWLNNFANTCGVSYDELIEAARNKVTTGDYLIFNYDTPMIVYEQREEMWKHMKNFEDIENTDSDTEDTIF